MENKYIEKNTNLDKIFVVCFYPDEDRYDMGSLRVLGKSEFYGEVQYKVNHNLTWGLVDYKTNYIHEDSIGKWIPITTKNKKVWVFYSFYKLDIINGYLSHIQGREVEILNRIASLEESLEVLRKQSFDYSRLDNVFKGE